MTRTPDRHLPALVAHADWSAGTEKRWIALAIRDTGGEYYCLAPDQVVDSKGLIASLRNKAQRPGAILMGFDFPIGLPIGYAQRAGIVDFIAWLPQAGQGEWADFFSVAETEAQISLGRPFYPRKAGDSRRVHLTERLGLHQAALWRACDLAHPGRRAACPLFWTLGAQQVGKAAISGWQEILVAPDPINERENRLACAIWPFSGRLDDLLATDQVIAAESYPAEYYSRLNVQFSTRKGGQKSGKRSQSDRAANASALLEWAMSAGLCLDPALQSAIQGGFGPAEGGEDGFDALIGLFAMLACATGVWSLKEPQEEQIRKVEGWILGQEWSVDNV